MSKKKNINSNPKKNFSSTKPPRILKSLDDVTAWFDETFGKGNSRKDKQ